MIELASFLNLLISSLTLGATYALGAIGVTLVFSILRFAHFAHGELMILGAFFAFAITELFPGAGPALGLPTAFVLLPVAMALTGLAGMGIDRLFYQPLRRTNSKPIVFVMASLGVMLMLQGLIRLFYGTGTHSLYVDDQKEIFRLALDETVRRSRVTFTEPDILTLIAAVICVIALHLFLTRAKLGKGMRAMSEQPDLARISGVDTRRVVAATWIIGGALACAAGTLLTLDADLKPDRGFELILSIFAATIVGGVGSPYGAIAGGLLVAFAENLAVYTWHVPLQGLQKLTDQWFGPGFYEAPSFFLLIPTEYKTTVPFAILILVLVLRPTGLFRGKVI